MKKMYLVVLILIIGALISFSVLSCSKKEKAKKAIKEKTEKIEKSHTFALSHYGSSTDTVTLATQHMAKRVSELSKGRITLNLHPSSELGDSNAQLDGTRSGTIDIVVVGNPYYTSFAPELNILDLPFLFSSEEVAYKVLDGEIGQKLMKSLEQYGLVGLAFLEIGFRDITNNVRVIKSVNDLKGLKLRTTPNKAHISAFKMWQASPTPMSFKEVYFSLKTGVIDGQENPVHHIYNNNLQEVQKYISLTRHAYTAAPMVMNKNAFNTLSADDKKLIRRVALESAQFERDLNAEENGKALQALKDAGMEVEENPDVESFRKNIKQSWQGYIDVFGDELVKQIVNTK